MLTIVVSTLEKDNKNKNTKSLRVLPDRPDLSQLCLCSQLFGAGGWNSLPQPPTDQLVFRASAAVNASSTKQRNLPCQLCDRQPLDSLSLDYISVWLSPHPMDTCVFGRQEGRWQFCSDPHTDSLCCKPLHLSKSHRESCCQLLHIINRMT